MNGLWRVKLILTNRMKGSNVVEYENFLHLVRNVVFEVFDELININIIFGEHVKNWKSSDLGKTSMPEMNNGISLNMSSSNLLNGKRSSWCFS